jgi:hypothetical protein
MQSPLFYELVMWKMLQTASAMMSLMIATELGVQQHLVLGLGA